LEGSFGAQVKHRLLDMETQDPRAREKKMDFLEELVMWNLCARYPGELFFCPQFDINDGWSCPDFLVLYPRE
jgi:hypothetical protein